MVNDQNAINKTVEANIKINQQLEDGKVHAPINAKSATERANIELQNQFDDKNDQQTLRTSPTTIVTPQ